MNLPVSKTAETLSQEKQNSGMPRIVIPSNTLATQERIVHPALQHRPHQAPPQGSRYPVAIGPVTSPQTDGDGEGIYDPVHRNLFYFQRHDLKYSTKKLGEGTFGIVYEGQSKLLIFTMRTIDHQHKQTFSFMQEIIITLVILPYSLVRDYLLKFSQY